ncbi:MAG: type secretion system protein [Bacillales bacterium]|jgi:flagellar biosynthesis protein|nr:type secretion system protein [Bacillales bacterium]
MSPNNNAIKRKEAIALKYDVISENSPVVVAKGKGIIAENILSKAEENNIPIQRDDSLMEMLGNLEINEAIPEELYSVVAELFAYIYKIDKEAEKFL